MDNGKGLSAEVINYGGILTRLVYNGTDVVLGRENFDEYLNNVGCFGAIIGRNSNRIENSEFVLNGKKHKLFANNGKNNLHGGKEGFDKKVWNAECMDDDEPSLVLTYWSPDGEEGFPGNCRVEVRYTVTVDNALQIHYKGECDQDTIINMTNHSYFNVNGHSSGSVENQSMWLASHFYTPNKQEGIPCGEILYVEGTPFDYTTESKIGERLQIEHEQIKMFGSYDHNLVLDGNGYRLVGFIKGDKSGITMEIYTDQPGMQLYVPRKFSPERKYKDGATYGGHDAICFETQAFPNNMNFSHFPKTIVKKGEEYNTITTYKFK